MYALKKLQVFEGQRTEIAHQDIVHQTLRIKNNPKEQKSKVN